jgi:hypothetical protein
MKKSHWFTLLTVIGEISASTAFTIDCQYTTKSFNYIGNLYICETKNTQFSSDHTVTDVTGSHQSGKTNADVEGILIYGRRTISFFPRGMSNFFANLIAIRFWEATFDTLHGDELIEFGQRLRWFLMYDSNVTTVSSRLFDTTPNLAYVGFRYNKLVSVGRDLFVPVNMTQLQLVSFDNNPCISQSATGQSNIEELIAVLHESCPFDDEEFETTTMMTTAMMTTTSVMTTTAAAPTTTTTPAMTSCFDGKIEDFVCDLNEKVIVVKSDLTNTKNDLQNQLDQTNEHHGNELDLLRNEVEAQTNKLKTTVGDLQGRIQWLEDKILEMTTHPCACK